MTRRPDGRRPLVMITGASAGIGAALAEVFAAEGWDLILTARREPALTALADRLIAAHGVDAHVMPEDLSDPAAPRRLVEATTARGLNVDGLVNNAGFSRTAAFLDTAPEDQAAMLQVMLAAPVELSRLLAPGMVERGFGRILNVASLAGHLPATSGDALYGPIKSFLIKASQGLHLELRGRGVHVTTLNPGFTLTEFHDVNGMRAQVSAAYPAWMWMDAARVAREGYAALEANRPSITPGRRNRLLGALIKHLPDRIALNMMGGKAKPVKRV